MSGSRIEESCRRLTGCRRAHPRAGRGDRGGAAGLLAIFPRSMPRHFARYVAIGDSSTEGLDDPDGRGGYRGWANRLADLVAAAQPAPLLYANLGVRGFSTARIRAEQLDRAVAMRPDLVTLFSGTNDVVQWRFDAAAV